MKGKLIFLGTGSSAGIPQIGCRCNVCLSKNVKNKRLRSSAFLKIKNKKFLIDVSPDFRLQALKNNIDDIDGVILTHSHYDHVGGLDELRAFFLLHQKHLSTLLSKDTYDELKIRFHYFFEPIEKHKALSARLKFKVLNDDKDLVNFEEIDIKYFFYYQKNTKVTGYRFGKLAYVTDIKNYSENIFIHLKDLDVLVLSTVRDEKSKDHFNIDEAIAFVKKVKPKKTILMHLAHEIEYEKFSKILNKENIFLAYDNQEIEFDL